MLFLLFYNLVILYFSVFLRHASAISSALNTAGTKVRIQASGAYFYVGSLMPADEWTAFGKTVKGVSKDSVNNNQFSDQFWPGTAYIAPMMMPNWNWGSPEKNQLKTQIRNLRLEVSEPEK